VKWDAQKGLMGPVIFETLEESNTQWRKTESSIENIQPSIYTRGTTTEADKRLLAPTVMAPNWWVVGARHLRAHPPRPPTGSRWMRRRTLAVSEGTDRY
jgi:hypothetical protein